jgi:CDP-6-deoxy-D-xylo-4-hexulose-3-dehydrase
MSIRAHIQDFLNQVGNEEPNLFPYMANSGDFEPGKSTVYYSGPYWDQDEIAEMMHSILKGKWLSSGEKVARFEKGFGEKFNLPHNVMVNSGSSANLAMIAALKKSFGWSDDSEILVCVCGFPTTIAPIVQNNLKPVFVDIDFSDLNWDLTQLESKITSKTVAVFSSPVLGNPYDFDRIQEIAARHKLQLISDNCDSLGSKWRGQYLTDFSVAASCSFYPAHHLCTMEGGMVSSKSKEIVTLARSISWWGRDCHCVGAQNLIQCGMCGERFKKWIQEYDTVMDHKYLFSNMGYNLKPLDMQGGVGLVQLKKWEKIHALRRINKTRIQDILETVLGVRVVNERREAETSWFGVPVICESKEQKEHLVSFLEGNRIQTRNYFAGNILVHPGYRHLGDYRDYPNANLVLDRVFFLGCSPTITEGMCDYIASVVQRATS